MIVYFFYLSELIFVNCVESDCDVGKGVGAVAGGRGGVCTVVHGRRNLSLVFEETERSRDPR
jgi:hypothetical protein